MMKDAAQGLKTLRQAVGEVRTVLGEAEKLAIDHGCLQAIIAADGALERGMAETAEIADTNTAGGG